jgi:cell filamentation protein
VIARVGHRQDRYDVSGNPENEYVDAAGRVMVNKMGIRSHRELLRVESELAVHAYEKLIDEVRTDTPMSIELLRHIHLCIFGDLYEWAGRWRTVRISKPGAAWPPPDYLEQGMMEFEKKILSRYPADGLGTNDAFCHAAAQVQGEFLSIHPFREGNARTIKLMTDLLASQTGRPPLLYDASPAGKKRYIDAAKAALRKGDNSLFEPVIADALKTALMPS